MKHGVFRNVFINSRPSPAVYNINVLESSVTHSRRSGDVTSANDPFSVNCLDSRYIPIICCTGRTTCTNIHKSFLSEILWNSAGKLERNFFNRSVNYDCVERRNVHDIATLYLCHRYYIIV